MDLKFDELYLFFKDGELQNDEDEVEKMGKEEIKPAGVANSIMSTSTIIPKEEIQRRLLMVNIFKLYWK